MTSREGREGFDFRLAFRARVSGRLLERGIRRYYLHRWPAQRAMKRIRPRSRPRPAATASGSGTFGSSLTLNPILRGWGNYFRTATPPRRSQIHRYVAWRLKRLLVKRHGRNLRAGQADQWTPDWPKASACTG